MFLPKPPMRLSFIRPSGYFMRDDRTIKEERRYKKPTTINSVLKMITKEGFSYAAIDKAVKEGFMEYCYKAGCLCVRFTK